DARRRRGALRGLVVAVVERPGAARGDLTSRRTHDGAPSRTRRGGTPRGCRLASDGDGRESEDLGDLVEVEAGLAREVRALVGGVAHVDRDERAPAGLAEELGVDPGGVEAGHGADGQ